MSPRKHGAGTHKRAPRAQRLEIRPGKGFHSGSRRQEIPNNTLGTPPVVQPPIPDVQRDHFDRLASALLDSPSPEKCHPNGLASHPTDYAARTSPTKSCPVSRRPDDPPDNDKHPWGLRSSLSQDPFGPRSAGNRPFSPGYSPKPFRRPSKNRAQPSVQFGESGGPLRLMQTSHLDPQDPQLEDEVRHVRQTRRSQGRGLSGRLPLSKTALLHEAGGGQFTNSTNSCDAQQRPRDVLAVRDTMGGSKSSKEPFIQTRSRVARLSQRISTKVSGAWGRLQGRGAQAGTSTLRISAPIESRGRQIGQLHPFQGMHLARSSPDAMKETRTHVAVTHQSHKSPIKSPTSSPMNGLPSDPSPIQLNSENEVYEVGLPTVHSNPFEYITEFDDDLEGLLPELPLAASTPRLRRKRAFRFDKFPPMRPIELDSDLAMAPPSEPSNLTESRDMAVSQNARPPRPTLRMTQRIQLAPGDQGVSIKKHPSPSKADLDDMAFQLRRMGLRRMEDDLDEIAHSVPRPWSSRETLAPRDKNQRTRRGMGKLEASEEGLTLVSTGRTRIPCPHGSRRSDARFGLVKHPQDPEAYEADELALI